MSLGGASGGAPRLGGASHEVSGVEEASRHDPKKALRGARRVAQRIVAQPERAPATPPELRRVPRNGSLPASFAQERLWFIDRLDPGQATYNLPVALRLRGKLDRSALERSLDELVERHETLRTVFSSLNGRPVQRIQAARTANLKERDLRHLPRATRDSTYARILSEEARTPFDLVRGPLLRPQVLLLGEEDHRLLLTMHHAVSDAWSMGVLVRELSELYAAHIDARLANLPKLEIQYADFACWQRELLRGAELEKRMSFWKQRLGGALPVLELPFDRPRPRRRAWRGGRESDRLAPQVERQLIEVGRRSGATLFMTLLAAFQALLQRYSGQDDLIVGVPVANRNRRELEGLIGCFLNMLPIRVDLAGDPSFLELLARVRDRFLEAYEHQDLPFEKLVDELQPPRDLSRTPICQAAFQLQNAPLEEFALPGLSVSTEWGETRATKFDLTLVMHSTALGLGECWEYDAELFDAATICRMKAHFHRLLESIVEDPERPISELPLVGPQELRSQLVEWDEKEQGQAEDAPVHVRFEQQVDRTPDATALKDLTGATREMTYAELDRKANRIARLLMARGVRAGALVGLALERSADMVAALLGVQKAGAAWVPLDPAYPTERLRFMLSDARVALVLTQESVAATFPSSQAELVCLDAQHDPLEGLDERRLARRASPADLAYVVYTSGSTGRPKGVCVTQRALSNLFTSMRTEPGLSEGESLLAVTTLSFDISAVELLLPLVVGAKVCIATREVASNGERLSALLSDTCPDVMQATPSTWKMLLHANWAGDHRLRIWCGGEELSRELGEALIERGSEVWNLYGPTETTIWSALRRVRSGSGRVPIGRPVRATRLYVLDRHLQAVPIGVVGELYIAGVGVSPGYLHRPQLTAERFPPDLIAGVAGARMYRTGDLARRMSDGSIEFLGRDDDQVKLLGHRIELGEIEAALETCRGVRECVAFVDRADSGDGRLVACVVAEGRSRFDPAALLEHARKRLPSSMVPSRFALLDSVPLTPNGKVDRQALATVETLPGTRACYAAPRTELEQRLAAVWSDILGLERVGIHDNFFELGGNSLLSLQILSRLRSAWQLDLPLRTLFEEPTIAQLAARLAPDTVAPAQPIPRVALGGTLEVSPAQERLWFIERLAPGSTAYNVWVTCTLRGPLQIDVLERSLSEVCRRHEVLRTSFPEVNGHPTLRVHEARRVKLERLSPADSGDESGRREEIRALLSEQLARPFELTREAPFRSVLARVSETEHILALFTHHIAFDGWSARILREEVGALYEAFASARPTPLPEPLIRYADYAAWQRERTESGRFDDRLPYWCEVLEGELPNLLLPTDRPRSAVLTHKGASERRSIPAELILALERLGNEQSATLFMSCFAIYCVLLHRWSGQTDLCVGTPVAGRERPELERMIGFFANTLVLRADLSGAPSFREFLTRTRTTCARALEHREVPFERVVDELQPRRDLSRTPLFQTFFALDEAWPEPERLGPLELEPFRLENRVARTDLTLLGHRDASGLTLVAEYSTELFDGSTIRRMLEGFETLLRGVLAAPDESVSLLPILSDSDRSKLVVEWNDTRVPYPAQGLREVYEAQVERNPEAIAVRFGDSELSYRELDRRADELAQRLSALDLPPNSRVALCVDPSFELVISTVGVIKANCTYVPLDPDYPEERLALLLADAEVAAVLTQDRHLRALPATDAAVVRVGRADGSGTLPGVPARPSGTRIDEPAYVMYTSGSTGGPKGVVVSQRGVLRLVFGLGEIELNPAARILALSPSSFDASTFDLWGALLHGGTYVVFPDRVPSATSVAQSIGQSGATTMFVTASLFNTIVDENPRAFEGLRQLLIGGEALSLPHVERCRSALPKISLYNGYGPTESTTFATCHPISRDLSRYADSIPIGRPIGNTAVFVLDAARRLVPPGVVGELYIGGDGLALGYLNQQALTQARFVHVPIDLGQAHGEEAQSTRRLYRTGDIVRWNRHAELEFLGRYDDQVKIHGHRIEPGEVESVLRACPGVRECAVLAREDAPGAKRLVAYILPEDGAEPTVTALRNYLKHRLPAYMIPASFIPLEAFPLSPNGKLARQALPEPDSTRPDLEAPHQAPRDGVEERVAAIWSQTIGVQGIGIHDDFFELGGNSLSATRVMAGIRDAFGKELPLRALFEEPTVAGLAALLRPEGRNGVHERRYESLFERCLIPLRRQGWQKPLFLVAGAHAHEDDFLRFVGALLPHLNPSRPVYGFKARGLDGVLSPHASAEEMAADYLEEVLEFQPEGPYLLAGNCVGGILAYEMARQLQGRGHDVALVALLDTVAPAEEYQSFVDRHFRFWKWERFADHWMSMRELSPGSKARYVLKRLGRKRRRLFPLSEDERRRTRIENVEWRYAEVLARYRPKPYPGELTLIINEELQRLVPNGGWSKHAQGRWETHVVPGDHVTRLLHNAQDTARVLEQCIDTALSRADRNGRGASSTDTGEVS